MNQMNHASNAPSSTDSTDSLDKTLRQIGELWLKNPPDGVTFGGLTSDARGSGMRKNSNKPMLDLIPVRIWLSIFRRKIPNHCNQSLLTCVYALSDFQEHKISGREMIAAVPSEWMIDAARVLEYGTGKYAPWNWLKGFQWSVPMGCALRHAYAIIMDGEHLDEESGLSHRGHIVANMIMLATLSDTFPEGDDRPPQSWFESGAAQ